MPEEMQAIIIAINLNKVGPFYLCIFLSLAKILFSLREWHDWGVVQQTDRLKRPSTVELLAGFSMSSKHVASDACSCAVRSLGVEIGCGWWDHVKCWRRRDDSGWATAGMWRKCISEVQWSSWLNASFTNERNDTKMEHESHQQLVCLSLHHTLFVCTQDHLDEHMVYSTSGISIAERDRAVQTSIILFFYYVFWQFCKYR